LFWGLLWIGGLGFLLFFEGFRFLRRYCAVSGGVGYFGLVVFFCLIVFLGVSLGEGSLFLDCRWSTVCCVFVFSWRLLFYLFLLGI